MATRIALGIGALLLAAFAIWHPAPRPALQTAAGPSVAPSPGAELRRGDGLRRAQGDALDATVYVAGAVRRPGLYRVRFGDRAANAVAQAGGVTAAADAAGVNLAAHVADGDEIYVPTFGESAPRATSIRRHRAGRSHRDRTRTDASLPPASVDVNLADATALAAVPGIGTAIAGRIVEMRALSGSFASFDELLDVAGMTQTRLDRARPFLTLGSAER